MTGKQLLFPYRSRSSIRENRDCSRHSSLNISSFPNFKPYYGTTNIAVDDQVERVYHTRDNKILTQ